MAGAGARADRRPWGSRWCSIPSAGDRFTDSLRALDIAGRLVVIGFARRRDPHRQGQPAAAEQPHRHRDRDGPDGAPLPRDRPAGQRRGRRTGPPAGRCVRGSACACPWSGAPRRCRCSTGARRRATSWWTFGHRADARGRRARADRARRRGPRRDPRAAGKPPTEPWEADADRRPRGGDLLPGPAADPRPLSASPRGALCVRQRGGGGRARGAAGQRLRPRRPCPRARPARGDGRAGARAAGVRAAPCPTGSPSPTARRSTSTTAPPGMRCTAPLPSAGETALVQGAAGGVGTAVLQLAPSFGVATIAVVSSDDKERLAHELGAGEVVRATGPWLEQVRELTGGRGRRSRDRHGRRRPLHRLAAGDADRRAAGRRRLCRRRDPLGQGQPAAAAQPHPGGDLDGRHGGGVPRHGGDDQRRGPEAASTTG